MRFQDAAGFLVFLASLSVAVFWVAYIRALEKKRHVLAGAWDAVLIGLGGVVVIGYTHDPQTLPWAMVGGGIGTALASWVTK